MLEQEGGRSGSGERGARRPDRILLEGLRFLGTHGALPEEAERPQPFEVDLELLLDLRPAGRSDDIAATVDYAGLCEAARAVVEGPSVLLVERLAQLVPSGLWPSPGTGPRVSWSPCASSDLPCRSSWRRPVCASTARDRHRTARFRRPGLQPR